MPSPRPRAGDVHRCVAMRHPAVEQMGRVEEVRTDVEQVAVILRRAVDAGPDAGMGEDEFPRADNGA